MFKKNIKYLWLSSIAISSSSIATLSTLSSCNGLIGLHYEVETDWKETLVITSDDSSYTVDKNHKWTLYVETLPIKDGVTWSIESKDLKDYISIDNKGITTIVTSKLKKSTEIHTFKAIATYKNKKYESDQSVSFIFNDNKINNNKE